MKSCIFDNNEFHSPFYFCIVCIGRLQLQIRLYRSFMTIIRHTLNFLLFLSQMSDIRDIFDLEWNISSQKIKSSPELFHFVKFFMI